MAKLSGPRLIRVHPRERLFRSLDEALEQTAVWVSGTAGAGKTTLIASYLNARKLPALWYQVDCGDADTAVCCHYLQFAATRIAPRAARAIPAPLLASAVDLALRHFFGAFYACIGRLRFLVLDNSQQALASAGFRKLLWAAIHEAPHDIRVIITSRTRPPSDFALLRANGELAVLDPDELLFTEDESVAVQQLAASGSSRRSLDQMREVHRLACGWAAGLKLLLQLPSPDLLAVASGRTANENVLFDYLATEVFDGQSDTVRRTLLKVAHLPRMTAAMADALCRGTNASGILETMHLDNLLTAVHGTGAEKHYEFHPLLRQFLLLRAKSELPDDERHCLLRQAAVLLAQADDLDAAARVLISARHWDELQGLVTEHAANLLGRGWHRTLSAWLGALPEDWVECSPWLCYWRGTALLPFDPPAGQAWVERAYRLFRGCQSRRGSFLAWCEVVDLICLEWADFSALDRWLDEADSLHGEFGAAPDDLAARFAASRFGALLYRRPQDPAIHEWAERLLSLIETCPDASQRVLLACNLQAHYTIGVGLNGELDRLMKAIDPSPGTALTPLSGALLWAIRSMHHWSRGQTEQAAAAAASGAQLARERGLRMWDFLLGALQVYAWLNDGEVKFGRAALARLDKCLDPKRRVDVAHFHYLACLAKLIAGEGAQALKQIGIANAIANRYGGPQQHALGSLAQAQALHAVARTPEAWPFLEQGRQIGQAMRSRSICFQADLCEALFALDGGDHERCARALQNAFTVGAAQDYLNHSYFRPAVMARLCAFALARGIFPDYVRRLIRQRSLKAPALEVDGWPWPVRIYTLGRFSLVVDGQPVAEMGRLQHKPTELLQALVALGGRQIAIPGLIEKLWPDAESKGGRGAFDVSLSRLRRLLGHDDSLLLEGGRLTLNPVLCWVDLWALERLLNQMQTALDGNEATPVTVLPGQADSLLRLYQGEFLGREECHPWALPLRDRLRTRLANMLADVGRRLEVGAYRDKAIRLYQRAIEIEPLAETSYRRLMGCLRAQGETAEALRIYVRCCEALWVGLRTTPSQETEAMHASLRRVSAPQQTRGA